MQSLLALPFKTNKNIPKDQQISTFDYLLKILRAMGFPPEPLFRLFIEKVFSSTETFLEEKVLDAVGASLDAKNITLSSSRSNADTLRAAIPATFLQTVKQAMAKELTLMVFGPRDGKASEALVPNAARRNQLIDQAICSSNIFRLSNNPSERNEDVEFNRVALAQQLEAGEVQFEINCQTVKIKMPDDPEIFFGEGGPNTLNSRPVTPAQSIDLVVSHVQSEAGKINNANNAESVGKSFFEILIGKLLSYITTLIIPHIGPVFSWLATQPAASGVNLSNTVYDNCSLEQNNGNEQVAFSKSLLNALYIELLKIILLFAIKQFKKMVANYFALSARERQKRKADKIKLKFSLLSGVADNASKASKYAAALKSLSSLLDA